METPRRPFDRLKEADSYSLDRFKNVVKATELQAKLELIAQKIELGAVDEELKREMMRTLEERQTLFDNAENEHEKQGAADRFVDSLEWYAERLNVEGLSTNERQSHYFNKLLALGIERQILTPDDEESIRRGYPLRLDRYGVRDKLQSLEQLARYEPISEEEAKRYLEQFFVSGADSE